MSLYIKMKHFYVLSYIFILKKCTISSNEVIIFNRETSKEQRFDWIIVEGVPAGPSPHSGGRWKLFPEMDRLPEYTVVDLWAALPADNSQVGFHSSGKSIPTFFLARNPY